LRFENAFSSFSSVVFLVPGFFPRPPNQSPSRPVTMMDSAKTVSTFITKLYNMLEDPTATPIIQWTQHDSSFIVTSPMEFQEAVLPKYFKHNNFSSFVRQLNLYGFHKVACGFLLLVHRCRKRSCVLNAQVGEPQFWEFQHEHFIRGQKDLLAAIRRRTGANAEKAQGMPASMTTPLVLRPVRDRDPGAAAAAAAMAAASAASSASVNVPVLPKQPMSEMQEPRHSQMMLADRLQKVTDDYSVRQGSRALL
jgi:hypothetical protein